MQENFDRSLQYLHAPCLYIDWNFRSSILNNDNVDADSNKSFHAFISGEFNKTYKALIKEAKKNTNRKKVEEKKDKNHARYLEHKKMKVCWHLRMIAFR